MTLESKELFGSAISQLPNLRAFPYEGGIKPGTVAILSGAPLLPHLTPMSYVEADDTWTVFDDSVVETVHTLTADGTPASAGTFNLSVDGETTAPIAFDADAADVQAALIAMSNVAAGDVVGVDGGSGSDLGDADHIVTLTWGGAYSGRAVVLTADQALISAGNDFVLANPTVGSGFGSDQIDAFLWVPGPALFITSATGEKLGQLLRRGQVHHDDIPLPTTSSQTQSGLTAALRDTNRLRTLGLDLVGISGVH